jgi:hypothetical protein
MCRVALTRSCLEKTEDANEYQPTTKAGGTWEIKSDSVKMAPHVGQTVTVKLESFPTQQFTG